MAEHKRHILVVGGGTAGSGLAARLSEDLDISVTLLEEGPSGPAPEPFEQIRATPTDSILSCLADPRLVLPIHLVPAIESIARDAVRERDEPNRRNS